ncbi:MAG: hypothetical protein ACOCQ2_02580 [Halanaerobiales bacterium]
MSLLQKLLITIFSIILILGSGIVHLRMRGMDVYTMAEVILFLSMVTVFIIFIFKKGS